jgi:hypothetical protein
VTFRLIVAYGVAVWAGVMLVQFAQIAFESRAVSSLELFLSIGFMPVAAVFLGIFAVPAYLVLVRSRSLHLPVPCALAGAVIALSGFLTALVSGIGEDSHPALHRSLGVRFQSMPFSSYAVVLGAGAIAGVVFWLIAGRRLRLRRLNGPPLN